MTTGNYQPRNQEQKQELPMLLRNMKKFFGENITGPIRKSRRSYQVTVKPVFLKDLVDFLALRGMTKLAAITPWETEQELKIAYHFIGQIGTEGLESQIMVITFLKKDEERKLKSIQKNYSFAITYEKELEREHNITFEK